MVTAIVLINVKHGHINDVAENLLAMHGVSEVYSVGGRYDLVAIIRVKTNEEMADVVTSHMLKIEHIENTETLLAFRLFDARSRAHVRHRQRGGITTSWHNVKAYAAIVIESYRARQSTSRWNSRPA